MSLKNITRLLLALSLMFVLAGATISVVNAERAEKVEQKKPCKDYDFDRKAVTEDEEATRGDCQGTVPTPEPVTILLFSAGLAGIGFAARRHLRRAE